MKRDVRVQSVAIAALLATAACAQGTVGDSGSSGGSNKGPPPEDKPPPPDQDSLNRNPAHPLKCERSLYENPSSSQLARLTHQQYANTLRDLFDGLVDNAILPSKSDFSDELKEGTFSNNVTGQRGSDGITEQREAAVVQISAAAVNDLDRLMGCTPQDGDEHACVETFITDFGLRAWRRPIKDRERDALLALYDEARESLDVSGAVETMVGGMLQAPQFLFRIQEGSGDVVDGLGIRLSDHEVASNLSYLLWDSMPDGELFEAADRGELQTPDQIRSQAERMMADGRTRANVRMFQHQWLHIGRLEALAKASAKDDAIFPDFGDAQADAIFQGMNAFLEDTFWEGDHSLTQFFTSSDGFVNDASADIYGVDGPGSDLQKVRLDSEQRKGILTQPFIMAGWANDRQHSAILRGAFVMDDILCAPSPPPPMDVERELTEVPDRSEVTLRQVVEMTVEQGSCAGCHRAIDGFGFLFENYDAVGAYQTRDGDLEIDASNEVVGTLDLDGNYDNAIGFVEALGRSEQAAQCAVEHFYEFAMARHPVEEDGCAIAPLTDAFIENGTDMQALVLDTVTSSAFRYRAAR